LRWKEKLEESGLRKLSSKCFYCQGTVKEADVVMVLLPDETMAGIYHADLNGSSIKVVVQ
jgi:ketol-acid reductoisomerase